MRQQLPTFLLRLVAWVTVACFATTTAAEAALPNLTKIGFVSDPQFDGHGEEGLSSDLEPFWVPAELGSVQQTFIPNPPSKQPFIIHIQDAHANPEAQQRIRDLLKYLAAEMQDAGSRLIVALEGAVGHLHPEYLDFFPSYPRVNEVLIQNLLSKGELTGPELFAYELYQKAKSKKQEAANKKPEARSSLQGARREMGKSFSPVRTKFLFGSSTLNPGSETNTLSVGGGDKKRGSSRLNLRPSLGAFRNDYPSPSTGEGMGGGADQSGLPLAPTLSRGGERANGVGDLALNRGLTVKHDFIGVEDPALYRENLKLFRTLLAREDEIESHVQALRSLLENAKSHLDSKELKDFLRERGSKPFSSNLAGYALNVRKESKRVLGIDLIDPLEQLRFPYLTRLVKLLDLEKEWDEKKSEKEWQRVAALLTRVAQTKLERERVEEFLKLSRLNAREIPSLSPFSQRGAAWSGLGRRLVQAAPIHPIGVRRISASQSGNSFSGKDPGPRRLFEELYPLFLRARPPLSKFRHFLVKAQYLILSSEIEASGLFGEITRLERRILEGLAKTDRDKALVQILLDFELLEKLLSLELTEKEFRAILRRSGVAPSDLVRRLQASSGGESNGGDVKSDKSTSGLSLTPTLSPRRGRGRKAPRGPRPFSGEGEGVRVPHSFTHPLIRGSQTLQRYYRDTLRFYQGALARDEALLENTLKLRRRVRGSPSPIILIAGGFHTEGLTRLMQQREIPFVVISPRIKDVSASEGVYEKVLKNGNVRLKHDVNGKPQPQMDTTKTVIASPEGVKPAYRLAYRQAGTGRQSQGSLRRFAPRDDEGAQSKVAETHLLMSPQHYGSLRARTAKDRGVLSKQVQLLLDLLMLDAYAPLGRLYNLSETQRALEIANAVGKHPVLRGLHAETVEVKPWDGASPENSLPAVRLRSEIPELGLLGVVYGVGELDYEEIPDRNVIRKGAEAWRRKTQIVERKIAVRRKSPGILKPIGKREDADVFPYVQAKRLEALGQRVPREQSRLLGAYQPPPFSLSSVGTSLGDMKNASTYTNTTASANPTLSSSEAAGTSQTETKLPPKRILPTWKIALANWVLRKGNVFVIAVILVRQVLDVKHKIHNIIAQLSINPPVAPHQRLLAPRAELRGSGFVSLEVPEHLPVRHLIKGFGIDPSHAFEVKISKDGKYGVVPVPQGKTLDRAFRFAKEKAPPSGVFQGPPRAWILTFERKPYGFLLEISEGQFVYADLPPALPPVSEEKFLEFRLPWGVFKKSLFGRFLEIVDRRDARLLGELNADWLMRWERVAFYRHESFAVPVFLDVFSPANAYVLELMEAVLRELKSGDEILILGSGAGPEAVFLGLLSRRLGSNLSIDAVDIHGLEVENIRASPFRHGLQDQVRVWQSDGFQNVKKSYDKVLFVPPWPVSQEVTDIDVRTQDLAARTMRGILNDLARHLKTTGGFYFVYPNQSFQRFRNLKDPFESQRVDHGPQWWGVYKVEARKRAELRATAEREDVRVFAKAIERLESLETLREKNFKFPAIARHTILELLYASKERYSYRSILNLIRIFAHPVFTNWTTDALVEAGDLPGLSRVLDRFLLASARYSTEELQGISGHIREVVSAKTLVDTFYEEPPEVSIPYEILQFGSPAGADLVVRDPDRNRLYLAEVKDPSPARGLREFLRSDIQATQVKRYYEEIRKYDPDQPGGERKPIEIGGVSYPGPSRVLFLVTATILPRRSPFEDPEPEVRRRFFERIGQIVGPEAARVYFNILLMTGSPIYARTDEERDQWSTRLSVVSDPDFHDALSYLYRADAAAQVLVNAQVSKAETKVFKRRLYPQREEEDFEVGLDSFILTTLIRLGLQNTPANREVLRRYVELHAYHALAERVKVKGFRDLIRSLLTRFLARWVVKSGTAKNRLLRFVLRLVSPTIRDTLIRLHPRLQEELSNILNRADGKLQEELNRRKGDEGRKGIWQELVATYAPGFPDIEVAVRPRKKRLEVFAPLLPPKKEKIAEKPRPYVSPGDPRYTEAKRVVVASLLGRLGQPTNSENKQIVLRFVERFESADEKDPLSKAQQTVKDALRRRTPPGATKRQERDVRNRYWREIVKTYGPDILPEGPRVPAPPKREPKPKRSPEEKRLDVINEFTGNILKAFGVTLPPETPEDTPQTVAERLADLTLPEIGEEFVSQFPPTTIDLRPYRVQIVRGEETVTELSMDLQSLLGRRFTGRDIQQVLEGFLRETQYQKGDEKWVSLIRTDGSPNTPFLGLVLEPFLQKRGKTVAGEEHWRNAGFRLLSVFGQRAETRAELRGEPGVPTSWTVEEIGQALDHFTSLEEVIQNLSGPALLELGQMVSRKEKERPGEIILYTSDRTKGFPLIEPHKQQIHGKIELSGISRIRELLRKSELSEDEMKEIIDWVASRSLEEVKWLWSEFLTRDYWILKIRFGALLEALGKRLLQLSEALQGPPERDFVVQATAIREGIDAILESPTFGPSRTLLPEQLRWVFHDPVTLARWLDALPLEKRSRYGDILLELSDLVAEASTSELVEAVYRYREALQEILLLASFSHQLVSSPVAQAGFARVLQMIEEIYRSVYGRGEEPFFSPREVVVFQGREFREIPAEDLESLTDLVRLIREDRDITSGIVTSTLEGRAVSHIDVEIFDRAVDGTFRRRGEAFLRPEQFFEEKNLRRTAERLRESFGNLILQAVGLSEHENFNLTVYKQKLSREGVFYLLSLQEKARSELRSMKSELLKRRHAWFVRRAMEDLTRRAIGRTADVVYGIFAPEVRRNIELLQKNLDPRAVQTDSSDKERRAELRMEVSLEVRENLELMRRNMDPRWQAEASELWKKLDAGTFTQADLRAYEEIYQAFETYMAGTVMDFETWVHQRPSKPLLMFYSMERQGSGQRRFGDQILGDEVAGAFGGLGVWAGDIVGALSDEGVDAIDFGLFYHLGSPITRVDGKGRVKMRQYTANRPDLVDTLKYPKGHEKEGREVRIAIPLPDGRKIAMAVRVMWKGRIPSLLFDTAIDENKADPELFNITDSVYAGEPTEKHRFLQEFLIGLAPIEVMKLFRLRPGVQHLNESATFFAVPALLKYYLERLPAPKGASPSERFARRVENGLSLVQTSLIFTIHTTQAAAIDRFHPQQIDVAAYLSKYFSSETDLAQPELQAVVNLLVKKGLNSLDESFVPLWFLLDLVPDGQMNTVSRQAATATEREFQSHLNGKKIVPITNTVWSVHWQAHALRQRLAGLPQGVDGILNLKSKPHRILWQKLNLDKPTPRKQKSLVQDKELWEFHLKARQDMIRIVRRKIKDAITKNKAEDPELSPLYAKLEQTLGEEILKGEGPIFVWARRLVDYKRMLLILFWGQDQKVKEMFDQKVEGFNERVADEIIQSLDPKSFDGFLDLLRAGAQFLFTGTVHYNDRRALARVLFFHRILEHLMQKHPELEIEKKVVFVPGYDIGLAQALTQGADVWFASSEIPQEQSGTSGQKAMMNGVLNLGPRDGFYNDGLEDGVNGFIFGVRGSPKDYPKGPALYYSREAESLYRVIMRKVIPLYSQRNKDGIPVRWVHMMRAAIYTGRKIFDTPRMMRGGTILVDGESPDTQPGYFDLYDRAERSLNEQLANLARDQWSEPADRAELRARWTSKKATIEGRHLRRAREKYLKAAEGIKVRNPQERLRNLRRSYRLLLKAEALARKGKADFDFIALILRTQGTNLLRQGNAQMEVGDRTGARQSYMRAIRRLERVIPMTSRNQAAIQQKASALKSLGFNYLVEALTLIERGGSREGAGRLLEQSLEALRWSRRIIPAKLADDIQVLDEQINFAQYAKERLESLGQIPPGEIPPAERAELRGSVGEEGTEGTDYSERQGERKERELQVIIEIGPGDEPSDVTRTLSQQYPGALIYAVDPKLKKTEGFPPNVKPVQSSIQKWEKPELIGQVDQIYFFFPAVLDEPYAIARKVADLLRYNTGEFLMVNEYPDMNLGELLYSLRRLGLDAKAEILPANEAFEKVAYLSLSAFFSHMAEAGSLRQQRFGHPPSKVMVIRATKPSREEFEKRQKDWEEQRKAPSFEPPFTGRIQFTADLTEKEWESLAPEILEFDVTITSRGAGWLIQTARLKEIYQAEKRWGTRFSQIYRDPSGKIRGFLLGRYLEDLKGYLFVHAFVVDPVLEEVRLREKMLEILARQALSQDVQTVTVLLPPIQGPWTSFYEGLGFSKVRDIESEGEILAFDYQVLPLKLLKGLGALEADLAEMDVFSDRLRLQLAQAWREMADISAMLGQTLDDRGSSQDQTRAELRTQRRGNRVTPASSGVRAKGYVSSDGLASKEGRFQRPALSREWIRTQRDQSLSDPLGFRGGQTTQARTKSTTMTAHKTILKKLGASRDSHTVTAETPERRLVIWNNARAASSLLKGSNAREGSVPLSYRAAQEQGIGIVHQSRYKFVDNQNELFAPPRPFEENISNLIYFGKLAAAAKNPRRVRFAPEIERVGRLRSIEGSTFEVRRQARVLVERVPQIPSRRPEVFWVSRLASHFLSIPALGISEIVLPFITSLVGGEQIRFEAEAPEWLKERATQTSELGGVIIEHLEGIPPSLVEWEPFLKLFASQEGLKLVLLVEGVDEARTAAFEKQVRSRLRKLGVFEKERLEVHATSGDLGKDYQRYVPLKGDLSEGRVALLSFDEKALERIFGPLRIKTIQQLKGAERILAAVWLLERPGEIPLEMQFKIAKPEELTTQDRLEELVAYLRARETTKMSA